MPAKWMSKGRLTGVERRLNFHLEKMGAGDSRRPEPKHRKLYFLNCLLDREAYGMI